MDELLAATAKDREAEMAVAQEVLEHVYGTLANAPEFAVKDGTKARFRRFLSPEVTPDGDLHCGFDIVLGDGDAHLEFTVTQTGSGKSFLKEAMRRRDRQGEARESPDASPLRLRDSGGRNKV